MNIKNMGQKFLIYLAFFNAINLNAEQFIDVTLEETQGFP